MLEPMLCLSKAICAANGIERRSGSTDETDRGGDSLYDWKSEMLCTLISI